jgi:hypothetical protein
MSDSSEIEGTVETYINDNYYLKLSSDPVKFEPVNDITDVFFDDSKQQVRLFYKFFVKVYQYLQYKYMYIYTYYFLMIFFRYLL